MNEATKALKTFAKREDVIHTLWQDGELLKILDQKFIDQADPQSQENFLETLALSCKYETYRDILIQHDNVIEILLDQIKSMAPRVTLYALRILRFLSMDVRNLERLQDGKNLRLTSQLIYTFNWLFSKNNQNDDIIGRARAISRSSSSIDVSLETLENLDEMDKSSPEWQMIQESNLIYREISKTFSYMLLHYDLMQKLI